MKWFWLILVLLLLVLLLWRFMRSSGSAGSAGSAGAGATSQDPGTAAQTYADADSADDAGSATRADAGSSSEAADQTHVDAAPADDPGTHGYADPGPASYAASTSSSDDVGWTTADDRAWEAESDQADAASAGSVADEGGAAFAQPLGTSEAAASYAADDSAAPAARAAPDSTAPLGSATGTEAPDDGDWAAQVPDATPYDGPVDLTADISEDPEVNIPTSDSGPASSGVGPVASAAAGAGAHEEHAAYGTGSAMPAADGSGPDGWGVKGNEGSMVYHSEDSPYYARTRAEVWFADEETAQAAGFARWDRKG